jgi:hypothetical protein
MGHVSYAEVRTQNSTKKVPSVRMLSYYQDAYKQVILLFNLLDFEEDFLWQTGLKERKNTGLIGKNIS